MFTQRAFCGLVLLANNDPSHLPSIKKAIEFVIKASVASIDTNDPKKGPKNWQTAANGIFLAEYQLATGDTKYFDDLKKCCDLFWSKRVTEKGTMGHHFSIPYSGGGLIVINVQAHLAWALAEKCGYRIDEKAWASSFSEVKKIPRSQDRSIGLFFSCTLESGCFCSNGRNDNCTYGGWQRRKICRSLADSLIRLNGRMRHAHAMSSIGLIFGFSGIKTAAKPDYAKVMSVWIIYLELARLPKGGAAFLGKT